MEILSVSYSNDSDFFFEKVKEDSRKEEEKQEGKRGGIEKAFRSICRLEVMC